MKYISLLFISLISTYSWSKCFSYTVTRTSTENIHRVNVLQNHFDNLLNKCNLTLEFPDTSIRGEAKGKLCDSKTGEQISVKLNYYCCDTGDCDNKIKNRIWFTAE